ncbi:MAG TPA: deoxyguanosinetriphosphate triphosphohydrolase [Hyphomicrobiaceae bacterium]|nr:deoxyguanosinetriphosphate triphosphohydrolase [Hyphomicrobiaceae bacterium]
MMTRSAKRQEQKAGPDLPDGPAGRSLAAWATRAEASVGRQHPEPPCPMRSAFQRDRDRIVHATSFRRLTYKTQVFVFHEGDHYRTRLTHSLEVAQIARAIARMLWLDEDLAEALALAHDLGHPPFGHAGERALAAATAPYGGFDHNAQSFKVVTRLERKYAAFDGLNLSLETLEGLVKHNGPLTGEHQDERVLIEAIAAAGLAGRLHLSLFAPAEAQVAAIADDIAYNCHDLDDGLRAGLISLDDLADVPLAGSFLADATGTGLETGRVIYEVNRRMITAMIEDVVRCSKTALEALDEPSLHGVRAAGRPVIAASEDRRAEMMGLKAFLYAKVYRHPRVMHVMRGAEQIVADLFARYLAEPDAMPAPWRTADAKERERATVVADFVAGMTDRYAINEHRRLFDATPELR